MDDHLPPAGPYQAADNVGEGGREGVTHLCASYSLPVLYPVPKAYLHTCRPIWVSELGCRQPKLFPFFLSRMSSLFIQTLSFVHLFVHSEDLYSAPSTDYYSFILKIYIALLQWTTTHSVILET